MVRVTRDPSSPSSQPAFSFWAGAFALGAAVALPVARSDAAGSLVSAVVGCVVATGLTWWAARRQLPAAATAFLAVAGLWAAVTGWLGTLLLDRVVVVAAAVAAVCAAVVTAGTTRLANLDRALATAVAVATVAAAAAAGWITTGADGRQAARVAPVVIVLGLGLLARHALGAGGLAQAAFRLRAAGEPAAHPEQVVSSAEQYLRGGLLGLAAVAGTCAAILIGTGDTADVALGLAIALLLWTRSHLFTRAGHVLPLRVAALAAIATGAARLMAGAPAWALAVGLLLLAATTITTAGHRLPFTVAGRPRWVGELVLAGATVAALVVATGLFDIDPSTGTTG